MIFKILFALLLILIIVYTLNHVYVSNVVDNFENKYMNKELFSNGKEPFVSNQCPTTMIKKGNKILLYNPKLAKIPGVNPIVLKSLKEYEEYVKWQRASNINCPILHLETSLGVIYSTNFSASFPVISTCLSPATSHNVTSFTKDQ